MVVQPCQNDTFVGFTETFKLAIEFKAEGWLTFEKFNTIFCCILRTFRDCIYFHFGYFLVGNLRKPAGSHFVFENKRLRVIFTA